MHIQRAGGRVADADNLAHGGGAAADGPAHQRVGDRQFELGRDIAKEQHVVIAVEVRVAGPGDVQIEVLEKLVEEEGYDAKLKAILADLRSALEDEKTHDFEKGRAYIQMALRREIASRLGGLDAGLRATFPEDVQLQKAIEILRNPALYAEKMSASPKTQAVVR